MKQPKTAGNKRGQPGFVRIISGQWRGRKLPVSDIIGLRPTTDRVKETLFNWLMHDITDSTVLDCFSGSGALAFEALSRYASYASLIEKDAAQAKRLQALLSSLNVSQAEVINADCLRFLAQPATRQYQIVLVDPPFRQQLAIPCCQLLAANGWLSPNALIYLETEKELAITDIPANWRLLKEKIAGQLAYRLWSAPA
ncbi:16S rRNA methyltransferase [Arsukibacterium ikkense]|uniref:Ribosomal RNA small subunit methyltransferase D n=1 Tax=Arsukibacterium ikkense TaxID=336831 RepID=A0A0M2V9L7_9GAMM|nr:16S rRNA (guanine(966)-N(2))-methyltransferase RsmD [Arsukibacterium ikkense]KKO46340.1 16S rRNA methyltransferase [Arsukibacterium ikkense]